MPSSPGHRRVGSVEDEVLVFNSADQLKMGPIRRCKYEDRDHWAVLTQMYGSVWPKVLPFCLLNAVLTLIVFYLPHDNEFTTDPSGHKFMAMILSFLVVTRAKISYARYMEAMGHLKQCFTACRELIHYACVLTQEDRSDAAKTWRHNVAYRTIILLRATMAAIEYEANNDVPWEIPELTGADELDMRQSLFIQEPEGIAVGKLAHGGNEDRCKREECFRAPVLLSYALRREITECRVPGVLQKPFSHINEELKLQDCVTDFMKGFHGLRKLVETPFPFPLVQMTRTFLFFWVFTLPLVLTGDQNSYPFEAMIMSFLTTFGFLGIEYVSMELDDPFGDDPNDFDDLGMAQIVFEDIYIAIYKQDGVEALQHLRKKIVKRIKGGNALDMFQSDYGSHGVVSENSFRRFLSQFTELSPRGSRSSSPSNGF